MQSLSNMLKSLGQTGAAQSSLTIDGLTVPVNLRFNKRARRIILRLSRDATGVELTVPPGISNKKALNFAASHAGWIKTQIAKQPDAVDFRAGVTIPVRGVHHVIEARTGRRTPVWLEEDPAPILCVSGDPAHHHRRIADWLKKQARLDLTNAVNHYCRLLQVKPGKISVRDQRSRWGSCSAVGNLSFSWRLILAPGFVLDYVAAHEVAHLLEMNHSKRFWAHVDRHCPDRKKAQKWLRDQGKNLHTYGQKVPDIDG